MINYLALIVGLIVSSVSAYYSILGLTAIFASAFWPVVIMGSALELGKLVSASWLYRNWKNSPLLLKTYLVFAVMVLMFVSSMGIFGFLSKAHIEQTVNLNTGSADQLQIVQSKIDNEKQSIDDLDKQVTQIDTALSKLTEKGQASGSLRAADQQRKTRDGLIKRKEERIKIISDLNVERVKLQSSIKKMEAEVGPLKYIAELMYEDAGTDQLEKAVRMVILLLVLVFDPLAVILLLAANHGIHTSSRFTKVKEVDIMTISDDVP